MNIILFGEIGAGKDTVAEMISEISGAEIVKLGKRIRGDVEELCEILEHKSDKRKLFQGYGESMRSVFGQDLWNLVLHDSIKDGLDKGQQYIIADARQPHEFTYWMERDFIPIAVVADEEIRKQRVISRDGYDQSANFNHDTEINARNITKKIKELEHTKKAFTIVNDSTVEELRGQIEPILKQYF